MRRDQCQRLIAAALAVLLQAAYASMHEKAQTKAVRLALRVLLPFVPNKQVLIDYWETAAAPPPHPWGPVTCHHRYDAICSQLRKAGWSAPVDLATARSDGNFTGAR